MRTFSGRSAAVIGAVLAVLWACSEKSPAGPTPPATCAFTVAPASLSFAPAGGSASVTVTTTAACAWTVASDRAWMTFGGGAGRTGSGSVDVSVTANGSESARSGVLSIAGQTVGVTQDGVVPCTISLTPASASVSKDAVTGTFAVGSPAACPWTAGTAESWISIASPAGGTGNGSVTYSVSRNSSIDGRTGAIRVGAASFTITQSGDTGACAFSVAPAELNVCMSASYELTATVTTQPACSWTATPDASWISLSGGASRVGPGEVRFRVSDNYDAPRLGVVKLRWDTPTAGQNVRVSQAGCRYAVTTSTINAPAAGGTQTFDVYQQSDPTECGGPLQNGCVWSAETGASWVSISTPMPQRGDQRVTLVVAANAGAQRSTIITVRDKTVTVVQAAK